MKSILKIEGPNLVTSKQPLPFPMDPSFIIAGIDTESASLFKVNCILVRFLLLDSYIIKN